MLKSKQISRLKYIAHSNNLNKYIIGKDMIKETFIEMLDNALEANEMIKISLLKTASIDVDEAAVLLKSNLNAEIVQKIGRTIILYRESKSNKKITKLLNEK